MVRQAKEGMECFGGLLLLLLLVGVEEDPETFWNPMSSAGFWGFHETPHEDLSVLLRLYFFPSRTFL